MENEIFQIDRTSRYCRTPRRNPEIEAAVHFHGQLLLWLKALIHFFTTSLFPLLSLPPSSSVSLSSIFGGEKIFAPFSPLFLAANGDGLERNRPEKCDKVGVEETAGCVVIQREENESLLKNISKQLLEEERRSLDERVKTIEMIVREREIQRERVREGGREREEEERKAAILYCGLTHAAEMSQVGRQTFFDVFLISNSDLPGCYGLH